jgi:membrane-associated phospholipid phosphatase
MRPSSLVLILFSAAAAHNAPPPADSSPPEQRPAAPFSLTITKDLPLLCAGIGSAGAALAVEQAVRPLTLDEIQGLSREAVNRFDRNATYRFSKSLDGLSDVFVYGILAAPFSLFTDRKIRGSAEIFSVMYAEAVMLAYALPAAGKGFFKRPRPFAYNPAVSLDEKLSREARVSFFSRHTTFAFASACFTATVYGSYNPGSKLTPYVWAGGLGAASAVGYLRFAAGAHFPTDILTGALAGTLIGCGVPYLHKSGSSAAKVSVNPAGNGLCLSIRW